MLPTNIAFQKPQQTIEPQEFNRLMAAGRIGLYDKIDGHRVHLLTAGADSRITSRNGTLDMSEQLPMLTRALATMPSGYMIDAELHVPGEGTEALQTALNDRLDTPRVAAFDILRLDMANARDDYAVRRKLLRAFIDTEKRQAPFHLAPKSALDATTRYDDVIAYIESRGIEGVVAWDMTAPHLVNMNGNVKRGSSWKIKIRQTEDMVATRANPCADPSLGVGSLEISRMVDGKLVRLGKVGSFEREFDRHAAMTAAMPMIVEVSHYGQDEQRNNLLFAKIVRARPDLHSQFGIA